MRASIVSTRFRSIAMAALFFLAALPAGAHHGNDAVFAVPQPPEADAPMVSAEGIVHALPVDNRVTGVTTRYLWLQLDNGSTVALRGSGLDALTPGQHVELTGHSVGNTLFVTSAPTAVATKATSANVPNAPATLSVQGKLAVIHSDYFDQGRGDYGVVVLSTDGRATALKLPVVPETLQIGMSVIVQGTLAADGFSLDVSQMTIVASPDPAANAVTSAQTTNNVLVMAIKFTDSAAEPFSPTTINTEFQTKVAALYQEQSYGQQLLNVTVACFTTPVPAGCAAHTSPGGWLVSTSPTPACNTSDLGSYITSIGNLADAAATAAGYTVGNYQNRFYITPPVSCGGWAGVAWIGWPYQAIGNGYYQLWVSGHELGHNFDLMHAGNLTCPGQSIGPNCVGAYTSQEYGDPFDVMGNVYPGHFNAAQKSALNWLPAGSVKTHSSGTATYTLSPLESPGQSTYAVKIPAASNRIYWIEYRQPIGFDSGIASSNGAQIRVANPLQFPCTNCGGDDTQILDMSLGTPGNFGDAALLAGQTFTDSTYGITIHVISATSSALTLSVAAPGVSAAPSVAGAVSRKTHGAAGVFDLPLSLVATNPTTEPREGPAQTIVFDFGKPITSATVAITEGTATAAAPTFSGNTVIVSLTGVTNRQYVTVALSNVASADGGTGGTGSVRIGYLAGDVNQSRAVSVADVALVNAVLAQAVTASNYLKDINASGSLTVADKAIANANLSTALPAP
jgi:hypothetical protein